MNAPTDTATLQEPTDRAEIHGDGTVIVEYTKTEAALADLRARYKGVAFDVAIPDSLLFGLDAVAPEVGKVEVVEDHAG